MLSQCLSALTIALPESATPSEKTAAAELRKFLQRLSGEEITIAVGAAPPSSIRLGRTTETLAVFGLADWAELAPDEVLYRTTPDGTLWIAGEGTRGTLYAVYELLEREYGVRFFTADDELVPIPEHFALPAPGTFVRYAPPFMQRAAAWQSIMEGSADFKAKTRTNAFTGLPDEWGGYDQILLGVHTMDRLVGAENAKEHPEWFALREGVRMPGPQGQPCLTNRGLRTAMTAALLKRLREEGSHWRIVSLSQNDNGNFCQCESCEEFVTTHGNQTDLLLDFVNEVADAVAAEFPGVYVETLAYTYTRTPPRSVQPRPNVAIRYCTIEARSFFRIESDQNAALRDEILAWREVAPRMLFWNYLTAFTKYYLPHPNWSALAEDIRLFRDNGAISVFEQGALNACGRIADLGDLRAYVTSRLLWNPNLETPELIREFCDHYYGPGAKAVQRSIDALSKEAALHPEATDGCYPTNADSWLSDRALVRIWHDLFEEAMVLRDDPIYGPRMAIAALPLTMLLLERPVLLLAKPEERLPEVRSVAPGQLVDWCGEVLATAQKDGILCENGSLTVKYWLSQAEGRYSHKLVLPDVPCAEGRPDGIAEGTRWWSWNLEDLCNVTIGETDELCRIAGDDAAVGGKAVRMPTTHIEWLVQMSRLPRAVFDVYLTVRCDTKPGMLPTGEILSCGNYPAGDHRRIAATECSGNQYRTIFVGRSDLAKATYFYCAPILNDAIEHVWIDRIVVANPTDAEGKPFE